MSFTINEFSDFNLKVTAKDQDGNVLPSISGLDWWVGDPRKSEPVLEQQTESSPTPEMEIQIPADANKCSSRRDEERFVIVKITRDDGKIKHEIHPYNIKALDLVPYPS